jgi:hypothetical protein
MEILFVTVNPEILFYMMILDNNNNILNVYNHKQSYIIINDCL